MIKIGVVKPIVPKLHVNKSRPKKVKAQKTRVSKAKLPAMKHIRSTY